MTISQEAIDTLCRPIIGIENRTAQEVHDIMCDSIRSFLSTLPIAGAGKAPEGWQLVPKVPTPEMQRVLFTLNSATPRSTEDVCNAYQAILNLAAIDVPSSPGKDGGQEVEAMTETPNRARVAHAICVALDFPAPQKVKHLLAIREVLDRYYPDPQPASTALVERLEALERGVRATSNRAYIASLNKFSSTPCLGWEAKIVSGKFGKDEMEAHAEANKLMGKHQGLAEALKLIRSAFSASQSTSREGER